MGGIGIDKIPESTLISEIEVPINRHLSLRSRHQVPNNPQQCLWLACHLMDEIGYIRDGALRVSLQSRALLDARVTLVQAYSVSWEEAVWTYQSRLMQVICIFIYI